MFLSMVMVQTDAVRTAAARFLEALEIPYTAGELVAAKTQRYRGAIIVKMRSGSVEIGEKSGTVFGYDRNGAPALGRYADSKFSNDEEAKAYVRNLALKAAMPSSWQLERFSHRSGSVVGSQNAEIYAQFRPAGEGPYPSGQGNRLELTLDATTGNVTSFKRVINVRPAATGWVTTELDALDQSLHLMDRFDEARHALPALPEKKLVPWVDAEMDLVDSPIEAIPAWRVPLRFGSGRVERFDFDARIGGCFRSFLKPTKVISVLSDDSRRELPEPQLRDIALEFAKKTKIPFGNVDRVLKAKSTLGFVAGEDLIEVGRFSGKVRRFVKLKHLEESDRPQKAIAGLKEKAESIAGFLGVPEAWPMTESRVMDSNHRAPYFVYEWVQPGFEDAIGVRNTLQVKLDARDGVVLEVRNIDNVDKPLEPAKFDSAQARTKIFEAFKATKKGVTWSDATALRYYSDWFDKKMGSPRQSWMVPRNQIAWLGIDRPLRATRYWRAGNFLLDDKTGIVTVFDPWTDLP